MVEMVHLTLVVAAVVLVVIVIVIVVVMAVQDLLLLDMSLAVYRAPR
jgi:hypothetical protein